MTVSANLGSMLTPIGNPQNLYLYTEYHITLFDFIKLMLPYSTLSLVLLIISVMILNKTDIEKAEIHPTKSELTKTKDDME